MSDEKPDPICNLCGEECRPAAFRRASKPRAILFAEMIGTDTFPGDGEKWRFKLCEACVAAMVSFFAIPPEHVTFCWGTGVEDPPHESESLAFLHGGVTPTTQESDRESYLRAMQRRAAMQGADVDPTARLRAALATFPAKERPIPDETMQRIEAIVFGPEREEFRVTPETSGPEYDGCSSVSLSNGEYLATVREGESTTEAGLRTVVNMLIWESRSLRRLLSAVLETVDEETRAKIEFALKGEK